MNLTALQQDVLSRLHEAGNSTLADLPTGTGGSSTITTATQLTTYLNDGAADLCRRAFRLEETGTYANLPSGTQYVRWDQFSTTGGHTLRGARTVQYNGVLLGYYDLAHLENRYPTYQTDASATPLYWYLNGERGLGIYPTPSASNLTLKVVGVAGQPVLLASGSDVPSWLPSDRHHLLSLYACKMVAKQNLEDPSVAGRAPVWEDEYERGVAAMLQGLWESDPLSTMAHFPPLPPPSMPGQ